MAGGVGIIIGAGIYVLIGAATAEAGAATWLAFALAAVIGALTALSYAELASMFPTAAAEYEYTRNAFPKWVAFLVGWSMAAALIVAAAAISLGFASYLGAFFEVDVRLGAGALLVLVCLIAAVGIEASARLTVVLSIVQVGGLLLIIVIGAPHIGDEDLLAGATFQGVFSAAALVFFAFIGFDEVITLAEETKNPTRTVPLALLSALGISAVLYVGVAIASVSVLGVSALANSDRPLADVMATAIGGRSGDLMAALALLTTTNTTLLAITASSRVLYGMAARGSLPGRLAVVHRRRQSPLAAIALSGVAAAAFVLFRDLELVASVTDFAVYLVFLAVNATVVVLRVKQPGRARDFKVPGRIKAIPVLPIVAFVTVLFMISRLEPRAAALGVLLLGLGLLSGLVLKRAGVRSF